MRGAGAPGVMGMVPLVWPVQLGLMGGEVPSFLGGPKDKAGQQLAGQQLPCAIATQATGSVASVAVGKDEQAIIRQWKQ